VEIDLARLFNYWTWWVAAGVLVIIEMLLPGIVFLWLGIAAAVVGVIVLIVPGLDWPWQLVLFAALSVVSAFLGRSYLTRHPIQTRDAKLNRRGTQYIGRHFVLAAPIENGIGKLNIDDTTWKIQGPDLPAGARVKVTGVDNVVLTVEGL
jgi:inner membrane protein